MSKPAINFPASADATVYVGNPHTASATGGLNLHNFAPGNVLIVNEVDRPGAQAGGAEITPATGGGYLLQILDVNQIGMWENALTGDPGAQPSGVEVGFNGVNHTYTAI